jgi:serine/threonine protein kinase/tetratricopeptide (TPR) repeat protein
MGVGVEAGGFRPTFECGEVLLGRFQIVSLRARGGMGEVYEAWDRKLQEEVALKTIRPELAWDQKATERFLREAHLARKVTDRNVCRIHDVFHEEREESERILFLSMELLTGEDLASRLERTGPLGWREAVPILNQILSGLEAAFAAGVLHRDLKAENVMLVPEASGLRAVVTDFGLAMAAEAGSRAEVPESIAFSRKRSSRAALGTPAYMSPEQLRGEEIDHRSDIFSFGVIAYEMLSGENPYPLSNETESLGKRFEVRPRSLREFDRSIPRPIERLVMQSLEVKRSERLRASELRRRLDVIPTDIPARRKLLLTAAAALGVVVVTRAGPRLYDILESWASGPRVLPLDDFVNSPKALADLRTGLAHVRNGANLKAIPFLQAAVREEPSSLVARVFLMDTLLNVGEHPVIAKLKDGIAETTAKLQDGPTRQLVRTVLARSDGNYGVASESLNAVLSTFPNDKNLVLTAARIAEEAGEIPQALRLYDGLVQGSRAAVLGGARCLTIGGEVRRAIDIITGLLDSGGLGSDPEVLGMAHSIIGVANRDQGLPELAIESFEEALNYRVRAGDRRGQVGSLTHLGSAYRMVGRLEDSMSVLERGLQISVEMEDRIYESQALFTLARTLDLAGRTEDAVLAARNSLNIELTRNDHAEIPQRLTFLSAVLRRRGQYAEARILLERGREHTRRSGDREVESNRLTNLAKVHSDQGEYKDAMEVLQKAIATAEGVRKPTASQAKISLAEICDDRGEYRDAERLGGEASLELESYHQGFEYALTFVWRSYHLALLGDFAASYENLKRAREQALRLYARETLVRLAILEAQVAGHTGSLSQAAAMLESCLRQDETKEFAYQSVRARIALGNMHRLLGNAEVAIELLGQTAAIASDANMLPLLAASEVALGEALLSRGDSERAIQVVARALSWAEVWSARPLRRQAAALCGEASMTLGRDHDATLFYRMAREEHLAISSQVPDSYSVRYLQHPDVVRVLARLDSLKDRHVAETVGQAELAVKIRG